MFSLHIPLPLKCVLNNKAFFCSPFAEVCPRFFVSSPLPVYFYHGIIYSFPLISSLALLVSFPFISLTSPSHFRSSSYCLTQWAGCTKALASQKSEARLLSSKYRKTLYSRCTYVRAKIANASNNVRLNSLYPLSRSYIVSPPASGWYSSNLFGGQRRYIYTSLAYRPIHMDRPDLQIDLVWRACTFEVITGNAFKGKQGLSQNDSPRWDTPYESVAKLQAVCREEQWRYMFLMFWVIISNMPLVPGMFLFSVLDVFTWGNGLLDWNISHHMHVRGINSSCIAIRRWY